MHEPTAWTAWKQEPSPASATAWQRRAATVRALSDDNPPPVVRDGASVRLRADRARAADPADPARRRADRRAAGRDRGQEVRAAEPARRPDRRARRRGRLPGGDARARRALRLLELAVLRAQ